MERYDAVILGAGAAGMTAAIALAQKGKKVAIIERQNRGGRKILASGNGRCNIANRNLSVKRFYSRNQELIRVLLQSYPLIKIEEFFNGLGLQFTGLEDGRLFPQSMSAQSVLELLESWLKRLEIKTFWGIEKVSIEKGFKILFENKNIASSHLIIATGSEAAPQLGGNSSGLEIAKRFGHTIIEPLPALVPLTSSNRACKRLAGLKFNVVARLMVDGAEQTSKQGDLLFTKYGVSGLVILDISPLAAQALSKGQECEVEIDFFAQMSQKELVDFLQSRLNADRNLPLLVWLGAIIHPKLTKEVLRFFNLSDKNESNIDCTRLKMIAKLLKKFTVTIDGYRPMQYAEVALGGVNSKEVDAKTLQSKKINGLYFCGEVLDLIGDRGGYNFYFAWASGLRVARSIAGG